MMNRLAYEDQHQGYWDGNELTDVVTTEIESLFARIFARVNTGPEDEQGRALCGRV